MRPGSRILLLAISFTVFSMTVSGTSFGDPGSEPVPNLTGIEVYDVSGLTQQQQRTAGELESRGKNALNLVVDGYGLYRFDFNISNNGSENWNISTEDVLKYSGMDSSWSFEEAFYNISDLKTGGNFSAGEINWNTSKGGILYSSGENSTMRASFIMNISGNIPQQRQTDFLANDTSNNSGSQYSQVLNVNETGYLNLSVLRPPQGTVLQRNRTFKITGQTECLNGVCGQVDITPRYNDTGINANTLIPESVSSPFYLQDQDLKTCEQYLGRGETCRTNFTVNATGPTGSNHLLDVNASSNITGLEENDSDDKEVEIKSTVIIDLSWQTVSFGSVDPGRGNVSAQGNSIRQYNITVPDESRQVDNLYVNASRLVSQVNSDYSIPPQNITHSFSEAPVGGTSLSETFQRIKSNISPNTVLENFFYLDVPYGLTTGEYRGAITFKANSTFEG